MSRVERRGERRPSLPWPQNALRRLTMAAGSLITFSACASACNTGVSVPDLPAPERADASATDGMQPPDAAGEEGAASGAGPNVALPQTCTATVCSGVIDPKRTNPEITAVVNRTYPPAPHDAKQFYCRPTGTWNQKLLLHIVGSIDDPQYDSDFALAACSLGYAAIAPVYENNTASRTTCAPLGDGDACYEAFHREKVYGTSMEIPSDPVHVLTKNSILARTSAFLAYLAVSDSGFAAWRTARDRFSASDLSQTVLSGHSQGSAHALYLAHEIVVARLILFGGPNDYSMNNTQVVAWVKGWSSEGKTPANRIFGFNAEADIAYGIFGQIEASLDYVGVSSNTCNFATTDGGYPTDCRRVVIPASVCSCSGATSCLPLHGGLPRAYSCSNPNDGNHRFPNAATHRFLLTF